MPSSVAAGDEMTGAGRENSNLIESPSCVICTGSSSLFFVLGGTTPPLRLGCSNGAVQHLKHLLLVGSAGVVEPDDRDFVWVGDPPPHPRDASEHILDASVPEFSVLEFEATPGIAVRGDPALDGCVAQSPDEASTSFLEGE